MAWYCIHLCHGRIADELPVVDSDSNGIFVMRPEMGSDMERVENMEELVSVVVPVYNMASKMERCLAGLCAQTHSLLEIIVVDDGSADDTAERVKAVAGQDGRIRYVRQENRGVAAARNRGVSLARGEYIAFCDGDDYVRHDYVEQLLRVQKERKADWVLAGFIKVIQGREFYFSKPYEKDCFTETALEEFLRTWYKSPYIATVWGKLYRTQLIRECSVCFPERMEQGEDIVFNIRYMAFCHRVSFVCDTLYYYEENSQSLTAKRQNDVWENQLDIFAEFSEMIQKRNDSEKCCSLFFARGILLAINHATEKQWSRREWEQLCNFIREHTYFELCEKQRKELDWFAYIIVTLLKKRKDRVIELLYRIKLFGYHYMQRIYYLLRR